MKTQTQNMNYAAVTLMTAILLTTTTSFAQVKSKPVVTEPSPVSGQNGNGGGGPIVDGRYTTFYSAGFYTDQLELESDQVPHLPELIDFIMSNPYISPKLRKDITSKLEVSRLRHYYRVKKEYFTDDVKSRLLAEYARVSGARIKDLAIYAVTDPETSTTYLLPEFDQLSSVTQKQAIMFHEGLWIMKPKSTYKYIMDSEYKFQRYLENPQSTSAMMSWLKQVGSAYDVLYGAFIKDAHTKNFIGYVNEDHTILLKDFYGDDYIACLKNEASNCSNHVTNYYYQLVKKFPNSVFIRRIYENSLQSPIELNFYILADVKNPYALSKYGFTVNEDFLKLEFNLRSFLSTDQTCTARSKEVKISENNHAARFRLCFDEQ